MCVCVGERETDRQDIQTDRRTGRGKHKQTDTQIHTDSQIDRYTQKQIVIQTHSEHIDRLALRKSEM